MLNTKICSKCAINKSLDEFYNSKSNKSTGKASHCKECDKELKKELKLLNSTNTKIIPTITPNRIKYEDVKEDYEKYSCILLTTEEDFNMIKNMRETKLKYKVLCCGKILESIYRNFTKKKDRAKCYKCLMNGTDFKQKLSDKHSDRSNEFNVPHTIYQEYQGMIYLKELLSKDFIIKKPALYCKADMIIKPKTQNQDLWLKVQIKTTGKIDKYQYNFRISNKNYDNHLLIFMAIDDKKIWYFDGKISKEHEKIAISTKNDKYNSNEITEKIIITKTQEFYDKLEKCTEKDSIEFDNKNSKREYEYFKKREEKFTKFNYEYPEVEGTIYDLKINNFKIQDKVYSKVDKQNYNIYTKKR